MFHENLLERNFFCCLQDMKTIVFYKLQPTYVGWTESYNGSVQNNILHPYPLMQDISNHTNKLLLIHHSPQVIPE